jgi:hypothetical protein
MGYCQRLYPFADPNSRETVCVLNAGNTTANIRVAIIGFFYQSQDR